MAVVAVVDMVVVLACDGGDGDSLGVGVSGADELLALSPLLLLFCICVRMPGKQGGR